MQGYICKEQIPSDFITCLCVCVCVFGLCCSLVFNYTVYITKGFSENSEYFVSVLGTPSQIRFHHHKAFEGIEVVHNSSFVILLFSLVRHWLRQVAHHQIHCHAHTLGRYLCKSNGCSTKSVS